MNVKKDEQIYFLLIDDKLIKMTFTFNSSIRIYPFDEYGRWIERSCLTNHTCYHLQLLIASNIPTAVSHRYRRPCTWSRPKFYEIFVNVIQSWIARFSAIYQEQYHLIFKMASKWKKKKKEFQELFQPSFSIRYLSSRKKKDTLI